VWIQEAGFASVLLPVVLGGVIGSLIVGLARAANESCRKRLLIVAVLLTMVCVVAEHLFFYFDYRTQFAASAAKNPSVQIFQTAGGLEPASFSEFLHAGASRPIGIVPGWLWWIIDAGLTIVTGAAAVAIFHRVSPSE
jgi:ABC-type phosphate transport system permease subunit